MNTKNFLFIFLGLILFNIYTALADDYSLLAIPQDKIIQLIQFGFDRGAFITADNELCLIANKSEMHILQEHNINFKIKIENYETYTADLLIKSKNSSHCNNNTIEESSFQLGSVAGCYSLEEIDTVFHKLKISYPQYISSPKVIGKTYEGRNIYSYIIGDTNNTKPQILITAMHHAREPVSMMTLIYYISNLLERENSSDYYIAKHILDNFSLTIVPCLNPDGYSYNIENYPNGGGMWRKNRFPIAASSNYGVDINRNYGPDASWNAGHDDDSIDPSSDTYHGSSPFSELETMAMKNLCEKNHFILAMNLHTYGNDVVYPWDYQPVQSQDSVFYRHITYAMSKKLRSSTGTSMETVNYISCGSSDDWLYIATSTKNKIFAMSPEIGDARYGFWPPQDSILAFCKENTEMFDNFILSAQSNIIVKDAYPATINGRAYVIYTIENTGLDDFKDDFTVNLTSHNFKAIELSRTFHGLKSMESITDTTEIQISTNTAGNGGICELNLAVNYGDIIRNYELYKPIGIFTTYDIFTNSTLDKSATPGNWGLQFDNDLNKNVLDDSPQSTYPRIDNNYLSFPVPIAVDSKNMYLDYWAKWNIDNYYSAGVVQVSTDNGNNWTYLTADRMRASNNYSYIQPSNTYVYAGNIPFWVHETINISQYINQNVKIRFGLNSYNYSDFKGLSLDNIRILYFKDTTYNYVEESKSSNNDFIYINNHLIINWNNYNSIDIFDLLGNDYANLCPMQFMQNSTDIDLSNLSNGAYFVVINNTLSKNSHKKVIKLIKS